MVSEFTDHPVLDAYLQYYTGSTIFSSQLQKTYPNSILAILTNV